MSAATGTAPPTKLRALADVVIFTVVVVALFLGSETSAFVSFAEGVSRDLRVPIQVYALAQVAIVVVLVLVSRDPDMARSLGLTRARLGESFAVGVGLCVAIVGMALALVMLAAGARLLDVGNLVAAPAAVGATPDTTRILREISRIPLPLVVPLACFVAFYEELLFRGFLLGRLRILLGDRATGAVLSIALSSAFFALGHTYKSALGVVATFFIGAVLGTAAWRQRRISSSVVAHALLDTLAFIGARAAVATSLH